MTTPISTLGEFGLIKRITEQFPLYAPDRVALSVGDDAAITSLADGEELLTTTDMLLEGVHFDLVYTPLKHLGYKSIAVNLSDICAMNGTPRQVTVSIGVSAKLSVESIEELYEGIRTACQQYQVDLIGGDTCASKTGLVISVTCLGTVPKGTAVRRSGAKINDLICVTGDLGSAYMGFQLLNRENAVFLSAPTEDFSPNFEGYEYLIERQLKPEPVTALRGLLEQYGITPTSMIDISDGLSSELIHIAKASRVGLRVYEDRLPIVAQTRELCQEMGISPITAAFNGGEDYELLFTVPLTKLEAIKQIRGVSMIGHITDASMGCRWISTDHAEHDLQAQGWNASDHL